MGSRKETKSVGSQVEDARDEVSDDANDDDPLRRLSPIDLVDAQPTKQDKAYVTFSLFCAQIAVVNSRAPIMDYRCEGRNKKVGEIRGDVGAIR
jgi:hypothetical protein